MATNSLIEGELFHKITRDERQEECRRKWIKNRCVGTIVASTGFGKSRIGLNCIKTVLKHFPQYRVLIIVPTETLQKQWYGHIDSNGLGLSCDVQIINTVIKHPAKYDLLVLDEAHRYAAETFVRLFEVVKYQFILGLTATFERLDGRDKILAQYCPVIDTIDINTCLVNGWVSPYKEYLVLVNVDDLEEYEKINKEFISHFEFFGFSWELVNKLAGPMGWRNKLLLRDSMCSDPNKKSEVLQNINYHAIRFWATMHEKKAFINNHPKKIEIVKKIIEARKDKKIITFANNIKMAEKIPNATVYSSRTSKKRSATAIEDFNSGKITLLSTVKKADEGLDVKGLSVAIIFGLDSSTTRACQRRGRSIRFEQGKTAEIFNIVLNRTQETKWFYDSHKGDSFITIDESELDKVLQGKDFTPGEKIVPKFDFRF